MNNNMNVNESLTQCKMILDYFKTGAKITALQALQEFGIARFSARLCNLEDRMGIRVERETIIVQNRYGRDVRVKRYWIEIYRKASELKQIINKQPRLRIFDPTAYQRAEYAKIELDALIKNNPNLFSECNK